MKLSDIFKGQIVTRWDDIRCEVISVRRVNRIIGMDTKAEVVVRALLHTQGLPYYEWSIEAVESLTPVL